MEELIRFENGLRLVLKPMNDMFSVSCGVYVGAGSANETSETNGISHFIEHMLFKGTERRSAFEIADSIDRLGGQLNAFTAKECTCFYTRTTSEHIESALDVLSDIFFHSKFDEEELAREKGVVLEEIAMVEDTPDEIALDLLSEGYFGNHPLGQTILGPAENIANFQVSDLKSYMRDYYTADNTVISIVGKFDRDYVCNLVSKLFVNEFSELKSKRRAAGFIAENSKFVSKKKEIEQCHICIAMPSVPYNDEKQNALVILNNILGGGMSSRLFQEVREKKGLAYSVYSFPSAYRDCGVFVFYAGVNPSSSEEAVKCISEEIKRIAKFGVSKDEFERGKAQLKGSFILGQESTSALMNLFGKYTLMTDQMYSLEEKIAAIDSVSIDDVNSLAKSIFDFSKVCVSVVGKTAPDLLEVFNA